MEKITLVAGLIVLSFILFKYVDANGIKTLIYDHNSYNGNK